MAARAAAAESGRDGQKTVKANTFTGMSLEVCACVCVFIHACMHACVGACRNHCIEHAKLIEWFLDD